LQLQNSSFLGVELNPENELQAL